MEQELDDVYEGSDDNDTNPDEIELIIEESEYEYVIPMVNHRVCGSDLVAVGHRAFCDWCNLFVSGEGIERWEDAE